MPTLYNVKPRFVALLRPATGRLARRGVTPNMLTLLAAAGSLGVGALAWHGREPGRWLLALPVWLLARMALNALDGLMARELAMASDLGAALNELGDVASDIGLYLPLALVRPDATWPIVGFVLGAVLTELCGVLGPALGASRRYDGPMGKSDRALLVSAIAVATVAWPAAAEAWRWAFAAGASLEALTCRNRVAGALAESRAAPTA